MGASDPEALKAYLAERDMACLGCGYNLRGLTQTVCPECGEVIAFPHDRRRRFTRTDRRFLAGTAFCGIVIAIWVAALLGLVFYGPDKDPLGLLALWVPMVMLVVLGLVVSLWIGIRQSANAVAWFGALCVLVPWLLGVAYLAMLLLLLVGVFD